MNLKKILSQNLKGAKKVVIIGVGSDLRADDYAGLKAAELLSAKVKSKKIKVILGATAPENFTGEIKKFEPSHIVIIDSADTGSKPGTIDIINAETVGGISFSTHQIPIKVMVDYLLHSIKCSVIIIGIQPKVLKYGKPMSKDVKNSVSEVVNTLMDVL